MSCCYLVPFENLSCDDDKDGDGVLDQDSLINVPDQILDIFHVFAFKMCFEVMDKFSVLKTVLCGLQLVLNPEVNKVQQLNGQ